MFGFVGQEPSTVFTRAELMSRRDKPADATAVATEVVPAWTQWAPYVIAGIIGLVIFGVVRR